ncbi:MAG: prephenate dehydrogenase/arogenate dehydrogenase family protein, partial [Eubacteriales bacterium]|nr:prephenate dehydrogenase/arogenate dehydrogenase family protein [Eubacteriales bacterium]
IVPPVRDDIALLARVQKLLDPAGFGRYSVCTAEEHDRVIAFTSQMAHAVSSAYIQNPTAREHHGFSAGSYRDLTRVAWLNPSMWTELFLENSEYLSEELDCFIDTMQRMRDAIAAKDRQGLYDMLAEGSRIKKEVDG